MIACQLSYAKKVYQTYALLVAYILGYMFLILTSFILWKIPETIPDRDV